MDEELLKTQVQDFVNEVLDQKQLSHPPDFLYDIILEGIKAIGYKILPIHIDISTASMYDLASVISQWLPEDYSGSADEIPISQILQDLKLKGWAITSPPA